MNHEILQKLEKLYLANDFKEALELLEKSAHHYEPSIYHFNKGTLLAKLERFGEARYHLELAKARGLRNAQLDNNLSVLKRDVAVESIEAPTSYYPKTLNFFNELPFSFYLSCSLVLAILSLLGLIKKMSKKLVLFLIAFSFLPISASFFIHSPQSAIVAKESKTHEGPSAVFQEINRLPEGLKIVLGEHRDQWFFIERPSIFNGWVHQDNLLIIPRF